jgi:excinuclease UvrABC nuclease subunit
LVRHKFNLRGCRPLNPDASDYKHCLYAHMKVCTAPCIGNVTREQYLMQVTAGCDFLDGQCDEMATELEAQMKKAAAAQDFEQAAQLRDLLKDIKSTTQKTEKFERVPYKLPVAINPESDLRELARVLGMSQPPARIEGFDISNISGTFAVASLVSFWHGRPDRANYRRFKIKTVTGQDDFACMAETIRRRYSRLKEEVGQAANASEPGLVESPVLPHPSPLPLGEGTATNASSTSPTLDSQPAAGGRSQALTASLPLPAGEGRGEGERPVSKAAFDPADDGEEAPESRPTSAFDAIVHDAASRDELTAPWVPKTPSAARLPDLILIDGGKGQLNAACAELAKLGLGHIAIIGLAKEFEEIYQPGEAAPLRLGLNHPAVKLLQRVRDESHRVANSYNAQLRLRKISESVLDEFPGVGDARKQVLLKKFGSIHRLRLATVEQIAAVPGFGGKTAQELKDFLETRRERSPG